MYDRRQLVVDATMAWRHRLVMAGGNQRRRQRYAALALLSMLALAPHTVLSDPAPASPDYFGRASKPGTISYQDDGDRSIADRHLILGLYIGAAVVGGLGLYFHLDSRAAADDVSNENEATGPWTASLQSTYDRAHRDGELAEVSYGVAGGLLIGAIVATWWTQPKPRTAQVEVSRMPTPVVSPSHNGGVVSAQWDF